MNAQRNDLEMYALWMQQEVRRLKPSTVSRRMSVVACCYRARVIDGLLEHSPAEHVRRLRAPPESRPWDRRILQFEALLAAVRTPRPDGFAGSR